MASTANVRAMSSWLRLTARWSAVDDCSGMVSRLQRRQLL